MKLWTHIDNNEKAHITTDALSTAVGADLEQEIDSARKPISFFSLKLKRT